MATSQWNASKPATTNVVATDVVDIEENFEEIERILETVTNGTLGTTDTSNYQVKKLVPQNIWIPASDMVALTTNGAASGTNEYATNDIMMSYFAFDDGTEEYVAFSRAMPEGWDRGTIRAKFYWAPASGASASDTVEWELGGIALSNDDAIDTAVSGAQVISDTVLAGTNGDLHVTATTPAITIAGTPALGDLIHFKVSRNVGGTDDMEEDAWLFGVMLQIGVSNSVTAWS